MGYAISWGSRALCLLALAVGGASHVSAQPLNGAPRLTDLTGTSVSVPVRRGRVTLVNIWATWCGPCRQEMPELNQLAGQLDPRHAVILGVAADDRAAVKAFVAKLGIRYPIAVGDPDQIFAWSATLGNTSEGLPFSVLLDGNGKVRWVLSGGGLTATTAKQQIDKVLQSDNP